MRPLLAAVLCFISSGHPGPFPCRSVSWAFTTESVLHPAHCNTQTDQIPNFRPCWLKSKEQNLNVYENLVSSFILSLHIHWVSTRARDRSRRWCYEGEKKGKFLAAAELRASLVCCTAVRGCKEEGHQTGGVIRCLERTSQLQELNRITSLVLESLPALNSGKPVN